MTSGHIKHKSSPGSGIAVIGITAVIGLVALSVYSSGKEMRVEEQSYIEREADLNRQIAEEEARTTKLEERKEYVTTNKYIEEVARDKLGLLNQDEVLIKARED